jgi:peptidoglycan/LPS O-acetylase OafA/YrhL
VQGLRAVAVLLVVFFHAGLHVPGGFTGVDVFFVISGFVIGCLLLDELEARATLNLGRFYARRIKRLLPALAAMLVVTSVLGVFLTPTVTQPIAARTAIFASAFVANFYLYSVPAGYFDPAATTNPLLHTWTLAAEEQFYLVFPTLLLVSWWLGRNRLGGRARAVAFVAVSVAAAASFMFCIALSQGHAPFGINSPSSFAFYSSPARAWEFGAGALLALSVPVLRRGGRLLAEVFGIVGAALVVAGAFLIHQAGFPNLHALIPVVGAGAVIAGGTAGSGVVSHILSTRPAVWIGDRSYSWYLWHWPLIVFATSQWPGRGWAAPGAAAVSLLPASISYRYVENPIRFSPRIKAGAVTAVAVTCVLLPVVAAGALLRAHRTIVHSSPVAEWVLSQRNHADVLRGCDDGVPASQRPRHRRCTWAVPSPKGTIVLVGDSNAGHYTEPVTKAGNELGYDVVVATSSGCPFVDVLVSGSAMNPNTCSAFRTRTLDRIVRMHPSLVVLAARTDGDIETSAVGIMDPATGELAHSAEAKVRIWQLGLERVLGALARAHVPAIVVHPVPAIPNLPTACTTSAILTGGCRGSITRKAVDARLARSIEAEDRAVARTPGASTLDFEDDLCGKDVCSTMRGDTRMYRNSDHLSVEGALTLTSAFEHAFAQHARRD